MSDKNSKPAIVIATRTGFFARLQLRSPVFKTLRQSGFPLVVLWPIPEDGRLQEELAAPNVFIERLYIKRDTTYLGRLLESTIRQMRLYVHPGGTASAAITQRCDHEGSTKLAESWPRRLLWHMIVTGAKFANCHATVRRGLLALEEHVFRTTFYQDLFECYRPGVVVTATSGYAPWHEDAYVIREARRAGIPTICTVASWDNPSTKGMMGAMPDYFLVWTDEMKQELIAFHDVNPDRIHVTGAPLFDAYVDRRHVEHRKELIMEYGLEPERKTILVGTKSPNGYRYNADIVEILVQALAEDRFVRPVQIIIRPHPLNYMNGVNSDIHRMQETTAYSPHVHISYPRVLTHDMMDLSWSEVEEVVRLINGSDVVVSMFSTMQLEAALADKPVINVAFDPGPVPENEKSLTEEETQYHNSRLVRTGGLRLARSREALIELVNQYLVDPTLDQQGRRTIVERECGPVDGRSAERTVEFILAVAGSLPETQPERVSLPVTATMREESS